MVEDTMRSYSACARVAQSSRFPDLGPFRGCRNGRSRVVWACSDASDCQISRLFLTVVRVQIPKKQHSTASSIDPRWCSQRPGIALDCCIKIVHSLVALYSRVLSLVQTVEIPLALHLHANPCSLGSWSGPSQVAAHQPCLHTRARLVAFGIRERELWSDSSPDWSHAAASQMLRRARFQFSASFSTFVHPSLTGYSTGCWRREVRCLLSQSHAT